MTAHSQIVRSVLELVGEVSGQHIFALEEVRIDLRFLKEQSGGPSTGLTEARCETLWTSETDETGSVVGGAALTVLDDDLRRYRASDEDEVFRFLRSQRLGVVSP